MVLYIFIVFDISYYVEFDLCIFIKAITYY